MQVVFSYLTNFILVYRHAFSQSSSILVYLSKNAVIVVSQRLVIIDITLCKVTYGTSVICFENGLQVSSFKTFLTLGI